MLEQVDLLKTCGDYVLKRLHLAPLEYDISSFYYLFKKMVVYGGFKEGRLVSAFATEEDAWHWMNGIEANAEEEGDV